MIADIAPEVSVAIPVCRARSTIAECLGSLARTVDAPAFDERQPPAWWVDLPDRDAGCLTSRHHILSRVAGSNLAVHRQPLLDCGGFATNWGPVGERFRLGEDTEPVMRVAACHRCRGAGQALRREVASLKLSEVRG